MIIGNNVTPIATEVSTVKPQTVMSPQPSSFSSSESPQQEPPHTLSQEDQSTGHDVNHQVPPTLNQTGNTPNVTRDRINKNLKPLSVPKFDGNKATFESFWCLFESLVDKSNEPINLKIARFRQCLSGRALEASRGLGVSEAEYEEAKEIIGSKFGGQRRQLRAYLDELEKLPPLRNNDVASFDKFTDLVRVTVAKLKADGREAELGEGTLHGQLVKKLSNLQVEGYCRWLNTHSKAPFVISLCEWLKKEVKIKMEAVEMAQGLEQKPGVTNVIAR